MHGVLRPWAVSKKYEEREECRRPSGWSGGQKGRDASRRPRAESVMYYVIANLEPKLARHTSLPVVACRSARGEG
jgi:hypothetical protein